MGKLARRSRLLALIGGAFVVTQPLLGSCAGDVTETYGGRSAIVSIPDRLPPVGKRALIVVLHGGLGNATRIVSGGAESGLNMDAMAASHGFIVAYLNGTPVTRRLGADYLGWNAGGGCCGVPAETGVDDVGYITRTIIDLEHRYGIDPDRVYGMGHSNGAMMTMRVMCETGIYAAAVAISGPLNLQPASCPAARGKRILALHGQDDQNVPVAGGRGSQGLSEATFASEEQSRRIFTNGGATYDLHVIPAADHRLDHIDAALQRSEGRSIQQKAAQFFGLAG